MASCIDVKLSPRHRNRIERRKKDRTLAQKVLCRFLLLVTSSAHIRISYPYGVQMLTQEKVTSLNTNTERLEFRLVRVNKKSIVLLLEPLISSFDWRYVATTCLSRELLSKILALHDGILTTGFGPINLDKHTFLASSSTFLLPTILL